MPRKSIADLKSADKLIEEAVEEFKGVSEIKYELAKDAYDLQDAETQKAIDRVVATLRQYATGNVSVALDTPDAVLVPVEIDDEYLGYNLLWLAVEIVKDLAFIGIRIANFEFPESLCAACGSEITPAKKGKKGAARG